ncbi:helix-turn-helix domain-containing protein [Streptomyces hygroscopicus]|uniref:helix-turn-helix domain-containing protein n=1 Tax=Streptomyces hygroscopicus TaxID=1912 RepID=UPI0036BDC72C
MSDEAEEVRRVLDAIDALDEDGTPPEERAKRFGELLETSQLAIRQKRQRAMRQMHDDGMSYRDIAARLGISFGRVRQILAEDLSGPPK